MKRRILILATVAATGLLGGWAFAQAREERKVQPPISVMGDDVGFRIEGYQGDTVIGTLVVRVNGKWIDAQPGARGLHRLTVQ